MASKAIRLALSVSRSSFSRRGRVVEKKLVASYYTKPKEKKGGSLQAWMMLGGVVTSIAGCSVITLGKYKKTQGMSDFFNAVYYWVCVSGFIY